MQILQEQGYSLFLLLELGMDVNPIMNMRLVKGICGVRSLLLPMTVCISIFLLLEI